MTMRRTINLIAALITVIGSANVAFAGDSLNYVTDFKVWNVEDGTYRLIYKNEGERFVKIKFLDENKQVLYTETVKSEQGFIKPFDLSELPFGTYSFQVEADGEILTETVVIQSPEEKYGHMVHVKESAYDGMFEIYVDEKAETSFSLYILNDEGDVIYEEEATQGAKAYDLSRVASDGVTVLLYKDQEIVKATDVKL